MMNPVKRAFLWLFRKWWYSLLVLFLVLSLSVMLLIVIAAGGGIEKASKGLQNRLMTTISVQYDPYNADLYGDWDSLENEYYKGPLLTKEYFENANRIESISDSNWIITVPSHYEFHDRVSLVPGLFANRAKGIKIGPPVEYDRLECLVMSEEFKVYGEQNSELDIQFVSGQFELIEGRHISESDNGAILISKQFAEQNQLSIGDVLHVGHSRMAEMWGDQWEEMEEDPDYYADFYLAHLEEFDSREFAFECPVQVVGIFTADLPAVWEFSSEEMSYMPENCFFCDYQTALSLMRFSRDYYSDGGKSELLGTMVFDNQEMVFRVSDPSKLRDTMVELKQMIPDSDLLLWSTNQDAFAASIAPLQWIRKTIVLSIIVLFFAGLVLLFFVFHFWNKTRFKEIWQLRSLGVKKGSIVSQLIIECLTLATVGVALAVPIAFWTTQKIDTTQIIQQSAIETEQESLLEIDMPWKSKDTRVGTRRFLTSHKNLTPMSIELGINSKEVIIVFLLISFLIIFTILLANRKSLQRMRA